MIVIVIMKFENKNKIKQNKKTQWKVKKGVNKK